MKNATLTILSAVALTTLAGCSLIPGSDTGTGGNDVIVTGTNMVDSDSMATNTEPMMVGGGEMFSDRDIVTNLVSAPDFTTLVAAVQAASLVETLQGPGPFTVFAPDNMAFDNLPTGTLDTLLLPENASTLAKILTYHVVPGLLTAADLTDGQQLTTVQGQILTIQIEGSNVTIVSDTSNIATVVAADVMQSNGVVHVVDTVLLPN